jgi:hypothetical protein
VGREQGEGVGDVAHRDARQGDDGLIDGPPGEVRDDDPGVSGPRPSSTEEIDPVVTLEAVQPVEAGSGFVGDHAAARPEGGDAAALLEALWCRGDADDTGADPVEHPDIEESSLTMP